MNLLSALRKTTESIKNWTTNKIAITDGRVSNLLNELTANPDYAATAEVVDIRSGYDGTIYDVAGDAVRAIGNELSELRVDLRDYIDASAVDGLLYEGNKLYLTYNDEIVSDPVEIIGGSGGSGSSNDAIITLTNTSGWIYKTIASGASCPVTFKWSSLENEIATGNGVLNVIVNGIQKHIATVQQGSITLDVSPWLSTGSNTVKINVSDIYGNSRTIAVTVTSLALTLTSTFDASTPYTGNITFAYTPTGTAEKTVYFIVDGKEIGTATLTASGRQQTYTIPAQKHGNHTLEVYFTSEIDGIPIESNTLYYDLICLEDGNTTPIVASSFNKSTIEQYDSIAIDYYVYDPSSLTASVTLYANDTEVTNLTVDRTKQTWTYRADESGSLSLSIVCGTVTKMFALTVNESSIAVEAETDSMTLYLSSYGRSNNEDNPGTWESGDVSTIFENFNFTSDGWQQDDDGITALRVSGDARLTIPMQIFATDFRTTGKTIEIEFATRDVLNYDAPIITCYSGERGLKITAQKALLKSEQSEISTQYKEDEHVRLAFVVEKKSEHRLLMIYINGILSGAVQYPDDDDFSQTNPVGISIGSSECTTDLYCIRVYDNNLTRYQVLDNWIADTQDAIARADRWRHNNVFDAYGSIVIDQLPADLPYLILTGAALPTYKGNKLTIAGEYVDPVDASKNFTFSGAEIDVQGTSSAGYERKNYKIKFKGGFVQNGTTNETYLLGVGNVPTDVFTFKADVASSEGANNVELVKLYNDIAPAIPPQEDDSRVRMGIDGYPIVIFHNDGNTTTFIGKYNFNHDKGTPEVFGFDADDESWETKNNTSNRALWKNPDFSGTDWQNDFEARHPEDNTDVSNLAALAAWIASTDRDAVSTEAEKAELLAKFKAEASQWLDMDSTLFYYLFTELFLLADSRTKNSFPTKYDGEKWCWLPYDMDTAIGINNEGKLAFGYELEDTDLVNGAQVYTGQKSVLWNNVRDAFHDELMEMYQELRSSGGLSYEDTETRFREHQAKWPEAIFNEDAYYKYLAPLFDKNNGSYLGMLQGSKAEQRKWWLYNRFRYIDSKYNAGDALKDFITLRGYAKGDVEITPYADIYATVKYGSYLVQERALRGSSYVLECPVDDLDDTEIYIYSASQLAEVGDLSDLMVGYAEFASGTKLNNLKLGDASDGYSNPNLTQLYLGNNVLLKTLDVRNCPNLGNTAADVNATPAINLSGCTNIEHVYFDNTAITGLTLPNGGILKTLHLPGTMTNLTVRNQAAITEFVMPSYANITTLRLENVGNVIPTMDILTAIPSNSRVRLIGMDWSFDSVADILSFYDYLDTMRGLDEQGNNVDKAQVSGVIRIDSLTGDELEELRSRYPDIKIVYQTLTLRVRFMVEGEVYDTQYVPEGESAVAPANPTMESTAQYHFTFSHWDGNYINVHSNVDVVAVFTETLREYTVYWMNGAEIFAQYDNQHYGTTPVAPSGTPVCSGADAADYEFIGWTPEVGAITGDTTYTAVYKYSGSYARKLIDRSIKGDYTNENVTVVGDHAFAQCAALTSVNFPAATSIDSYAFDYCYGLVSVSVPAVTTVASNAFRNSTGLASLRLPAVTSIGNRAFVGCRSLTALVLSNTEAVCVLSGTGFSSSTPIESGTGYIYVPSTLLADYQAATNWSAYASQFRALEDYTIDGTTTGELDPNKI